MHLKLSAYFVPQIGCVLFLVCLALYLQLMGQSGSLTAVIAQLCSAAIKLELERGHLCLEPQSLVLLLPLLASLSRVSLNQNLPGTLSAISCVEIRVISTRQSMLQLTCSRSNSTSSPLCFPQLRLATFAPSLKGSRSLLPLSLLRSFIFNASFSSFKRAMVS